MARRRRARAAIEPERVIRGEVELSAYELLRLIHEVNPTNKRRGAQETGRRYDLKSQLQSLLLRLYPDEISVEATDQPGVVGLRHRFSGLYASHAIVELLDADVRPGGSGDGRRR